MGGADVPLCGMSVPMGRRPAKTHEKHAGGADVPHFGMSAPLSTERTHPAKERRDVCATHGFSTLRLSDAEQART